MKVLATRLIKALAFLFATCLASLVLITWLHSSPHTPVATWKQPASIQYHSFDPYYLSVIKDDWDWSSFPLELRQAYSIYVGRESGEPAYGHSVKHSFHPGPESSFNEATHIKQSTVDWTEEGVTFHAPSGHRLFIPKAMFIGGR